MANIKIRYQKVSDAERFYKILNNPNFIYFPVKPKTIREEINFLKQTDKKRKKNLEHNFSIIHNKKLIGAIGIMINQHRTNIGEIGYFIDEPYWNKGLATKAVKLAEQFAFKKLKLHRLEILMNPQNKASVKVAQKNNYRKEGLLKKYLSLNNKYYNSYLFAKSKR